MIYFFCKGGDVMKRTVSFICVGFFVWAGFAHAQMTSTNFQIRWDSINAGGSDTSSSASYLLRETIESAVGGNISSASYQVDQGYRSGIFDRLIDFNLYIQNHSDERAVSGLSSLVITTTTTDVSVNDYVLLIQDKGENQVSAIGQVTAVGASTITVDALKDGGTAVAVDGVDDYLYVLDATAIDMGTLSIAALTTSVLAWEVSVDNSNGYVVQVLEDGNFRDGSNTIADVSDGAVTIGAGEYGARSSDTSIANSTFDTADTALTTSFQDVATESAAIFESRNFLTIKVAPSSSNITGSYAHTVSIIASGNY
jgi:hypothetical protein